MESGTRDSGSVFYRKSLELTNILVYELTYYSLVPNLGGLMKKQISTKAVHNLFKMHYDDGEYFLSIAEDHRKENNKELEWRYSRSAILSYFFSIEALINFILYDRHSKNISSTPTLDNLEKMRIYDKYLLAPLICDGFSGESLDKNDLECLNRLTNLRNNYVHSKYVSIKKSKPTKEIDVIATILTTTGGLKEVLPDIRTKDEKDDITDIKKNIISLDYEDALKTKEIIDWLLKKMNNLLRGLVLGKKDVSGISEHELFAERAGLFTAWMKTDFFVDLDEKEFKKLDDLRLKNVFASLIEEKLSGIAKEIIDSMSSERKEQFIAMLVTEYKLRHSHAEDKRKLQ